MTTAAKAERKPRTPSPKSLAELTPHFKGLPLKDKIEAGKQLAALIKEEEAALLAQLDLITSNGEKK